MNRSSSIYKQKQFETNKLVVSDVRGQQWMDFFTGESIIFGLWTELVWLEAMAWS